MSRILLDSCTLLWLELAPSRVPPALTAILADRDNDVFVSAASVWEIAIKWSTGRLALPSDPSEFVMKLRVKSSLDSLVVDEASALQTARLPALHKDPFDRILIAQAIEHGLAIATPDPLIRQYAVKTIWD